MTRLLTVLCLLLALTVSAADSERVTLTLTVTNPPVTGHSLTVNSSTRIWTNQTTSAFILTNSTVNNSATNLFLHIAATPFGSPRMILQWADTNQIKLIGQIGQVITVNTSGFWATWSLSTQSGPTTVNAVYPFANIVGDTNRTNQASKFVLGMSDYATNSFSTGAVALANHMSLGIAPGGLTQTAKTAKVFWNLSGTNGGTIAGGLYALPKLSNPVFTNATNFGLAITSPGTASESEQFGGGATATNAGALAVGANALAGAISSTAIGNDALATGTGGSVAIGNGAQATNEQSSAMGSSARAYGTNTIAIGSEALAQTNNAIAIGTTATATLANSIAIGTGAAAGHDDSIAIGTSASTTSTNQIRLGSASHLVSVPGAISGTVTNGAIAGTNRVSGRLEYQAAVNANLANGNNTGILLGTNVYVRLVGSSAATTNGGFVAEPAGSYHLVQITNPVPPVVIVNDALDGTAANRILTGTGADLLLTNNPVMLQIIYDGAASRWRVISPSRSQ